MICTCGKEGVFVEFDTFNYWYCRSCKLEIMPAKPRQVTATEVNASFDAAARSIQDSIEQELLQQFQDLLDGKINEFWVGDDLMLRGKYNSSEIYYYGPVNDYYLGNERSTKEELYERYKKIIG